MIINNVYPQNKILYTCFSHPLPTGNKLLEFVGSSVVCYQLPTCSGHVLGKDQNTNRGKLFHDWCYL